MAELGQEYVNGVKSGAFSRAGLAGEHVWRQQAVRGHIHPGPGRAVPQQGHLSVCLLSRVSLYKPLQLGMKRLMQISNGVSGRLYAVARGLCLILVCYGVHYLLAYMSCAAAGMWQRTCHPGEATKPQSRARRRLCGLSLHAPLDGTGKFYSDCKEEPF